MTVEKAENDNSIYIRYSREGNSDIQQFKIIMSCIKKKIRPEMNIVIDFRESRDISSGEIGSIVRLATSLEASSTFLYIIACEELYDQLTSINLTHLDHLSVCKNRQDFTDHLEKWFARIFGEN